MQRVLRHLEPVAGSCQLAKVRFSELRREVVAPRNGGAFWPSAAEELLLRTILDGGTGRDGLACWREWKETVPAIDGRLDVASLRLLPLVYKNLAERGVDDPAMPRLKEIYRNAWIGNQLLFAELGKALRVLAGAGIETLVLKGAALGELHYRDRGARPMGDCDVAVRLDRRHDAIDALTSAGWRLAAADSLAFDLAFRHGCALQSEAGVELDLHWHLFSDCCRATADPPMWDDSIAFAIDGAATRALDPTDSLFHALVHGTRWNPVSPVRWVTDAAVLLQTSAASMDWDRLVRRSTDALFVLRVGSALSFLFETFDLGIPADAVDAIDRAPVSRLERVEYRCLAGPDSWSGVNLASLLLAAVHCARATDGSTTSGRTAYLARYLRARLRGKRVLRRFAADPAAALRLPGSPDTGDLP